MSPYTTADIHGVAYHIIEHVSDYHTLTSLSMTSKLFNDLVTARYDLRHRLFRKLETPSILSDDLGHLYGCKEKLDCWCNSLRQSFGDLRPDWQSSDLAKYGGPNFRESNS